MNQEQNVESSRPTEVKNPEPGLGFFTQKMKTLSYMKFFYAKTLATRALLRFHQISFNITKTKFCCNPMMENIISFNSFFLGGYALNTSVFIEGEMKCPVGEKPQFLFPDKAFGYNIIISQ